MRLVIAGVAMSILVGACSAAPATTTVLVDPNDTDTVIDVVFAEGFATGTEPVVEIDLGQTVTISIVSDTPDEIHIHGGYDLFFGVPRAQQVTFSFVADRIGVFAVELESSGYLLFELDVG